MFQLKVSKVAKVNMYKIYYNFSETEAAVKFPLLAVCQNTNSKQTRRGSAKTTKEIFSAKGPKLQANPKPRTQKTGKAEVELSMGNKIIEWPEAQLQAERQTYEMLYPRSLSNEGLPSLSPLTQFRKVVNRSRSLY